MGADGMASGGIPGCTRNPIDPWEMSDSREVGTMFAWRRRSLGACALVAHMPPARERPIPWGMAAKDIEAET
jgi:hypothetical protein